VSKEIYNKMLREVIDETAEILRTGSTTNKIRIGLTTYGSEISPDELVQGAYIAMRKQPGLEVSIIGPAMACDLPVYEAGDEDEVHAILEKLLDKKELDGVVTMHYPFPIGVATIGKVITPTRGKSMYIASTTGTSDTDRIQAMVKNAVYGIAAAKADGITNPTLGILNVDGARQVERFLKSMQSSGYDFSWGESQRADRGHVLRGNDLILGSVDVVVCDTLTGNILMKLFSSFNSGGDYETVGYGYGPGVGENFNRLISIISRASGTPVVANAISYCASMVSGGLDKIKQGEIRKAQQAGWTVPSAPKVEAAARDEIAPPPAKVTDDQIPGVDILELDDAVKSLWKERIFASTGMGCTGPVILIAGEDKEKAIKILRANQYL
jgi:hypothetical protein